MKKFLCCLYAAIACFLLVSCSSKPADVVENYLSDLKAGRYSEIPDYMHSSKAEWTEKERAEIVSLYETKIDESIKKNDGIQSYRIDSEEIALGGEEATVSYTIIYGNGEEEPQSCTVVKVDGEWKMGVNK